MVKRCSDMTEVREEIDRLDRELVSLLAERQAYVAQAAILKPGRDKVRDPARIEDVVAKVRAASDTAGFSSEIAEKVWRVMIDAFIAFEDREYVRRRGTE